MGFGVMGAVLLTAQALRGTLSSFKRRRMRCAGAPVLTSCPLELFDHPPV